VSLFALKTSRLLSIWWNAFAWALRIVQLLALIFPLRQLVPEGDVPSAGKRPAITQSILQLDSSCGLLSARSGDPAENGGEVVHKTLEVDAGAYAIGLRSY
jgi:hypothetical protein